jgi:hypothetical protein
MKTVAAISFLNNHSLSMDVEEVTGIQAGLPIQVEEGMWTCELLIRSSHGTVALQLLSDSEEPLRVRQEMA